MSVTSTGNTSLDTVTNSYRSSDEEKSQESDALGRDTFLTMLVAQLQNQDPLNPMDGTDFSAQLAQFSQLEQLMNLNDSMGNLAQAYTKNSEGDATSYLGKQVTGNVDVMNVEEGSVSGGFYNLSAAADIMVTITDADDNTVKTLYDGQQTAGSHLISWDGTDNNGDAVADGTYHYTVMANTGHGYTELPSSITGTVDGVTYNDGKAYLVVQGVLLDPQSLTAVMDSENSGTSGSVDSAMEYLGRTVSSNSPIVLVEDGAVDGEDLSFEMDSQEDVTVKIYDAFDELVRTIQIDSADTVGGENLVRWDGVSDSGYQVSDGLYYYTVKAGSSFADTLVHEEVSGIRNMNNSQFLVLKDSGRLVSLSTITAVTSN